MWWTVFRFVNMGVLRICSTWIFLWWKAKWKGSDHTSAGVVVICYCQNDHNNANFHQWLHCNKSTFKLVILAHVLGGSRWLLVADRAKRAHRNLKFRSSGPRSERAGGPHKMLASEGAIAAGNRARARTIARRIASVVMRTRRWLYLLRAPSLESRAQLPTTMFKWASIKLSDIFRCFLLLAVCFSNARICAQGNFSIANLTTNYNNCRNNELWCAFHCDRW